MKDRMNMAGNIEIYVDGASRGNPGPSGIGIFIRDKDGKDIIRRGEFLGEMTSNVAEYQALIQGLKHLIKLNPHDASKLSVKVFSDSILLINQLTGNYRIKSQNLIPLAIQARRLVKRFKAVEFTVVERRDNKIADKLANKAMNLMDTIDELAQG